jgi:nucleoside-diphosphate-sugar epimerase
MEWTILRPPLVYGPGVKGNFLQLLRAVDRGIPLPLRSIDNRRSLLNVGNLCDAIEACIDSPAARNRIFLVSDDEDVSTPDLVRRIAAAMGKPAKLFSCPPALLRYGARLIGRGAAADRLTGSLTVDSSAIRQTLGWQARIHLDQGLIETARWYHRAPQPNGA